MTSTVIEGHLYHMIILTLTYILMDNFLSLFSMCVMKENIINQLKIITVQFTRYYEFSLPELK